MFELDHTLNQRIVQDLYTIFRGDDGKVPVQVMVDNLFGRATETTSFRVEALKKLYIDLF